MHADYTSLIPPLFVLLCAALTRKVIWSLVVGIASAAVIIGKDGYFSVIFFMLEQLWQQISDPTNLYTFGFLIVLGMLITLISLVGGATAYGLLIKKIIKTPRSIKLASIGLSLLFMIDDFFSSLAVGCIMKPLTDSFKIPRVKLAFLIDSLSAPLVIIMPISTWIAMLLMQLNKAGIATSSIDKPLFIEDPFVAYLYIIPYTFYSFAILASVWFIVYKQISFGPMKTQEDIANRTGNLFGGKKELVDTTTSCGPQGTITDFALPLLSLLGCIFLTVLYSGNSWLLGGTHGMLQTIQAANIFLSLFIGSLYAFIISMGYMLYHKKLSLYQMKDLAQGSYGLMAESMIILLLAWAFSSILKNNLHTGNYIASLLIGSMPAYFLPCIFFIASLITASVTGSSWGTIAVMLPIAIPMTASFLGINEATAFLQAPLLMPIIGGIFSGAVAGDHLSPLGTTTVMSATSSGAYLYDHVITQLPYAIPALIATCIGYLIAGYCIDIYGYFYCMLISLSASIGLSILMLGIVDFFKKNK